MDFIKDYGSIILSAVGALFVLIWKAACVVKQVQMLNERVEEQNDSLNARMDHLERHLEKMNDKLDRALDVRNH